LPTFEILRITGRTENPNYIKNQFLIKTKNQTTMKKIFLIVLASMSIIACKESNRNSPSKNKTEIKFKDLDLIKSKNKSEIEEFLIKCNYNFINNQPKSFQWKSEENEDIIQFNGNGVLVFLTYNNQTYNKLIIDLKKSTYKYSGKSVKNNLELESYTKNKETIFISTMINPEDGKKVYSLTFI
jgi:hypothetical protein